ncbi:MAG: hypothetical protein LBN08_02245 [Lactobacillales bacterium]|jgi:hypothetical protein|nr:hypothetical protein [Lactobacillales bacterium]
MKRYLCGLLASATLFSGLTIQASAEDGTANTTADAILKPLSVIPIRLPGTYFDDPFRIYPENGNLEAYQFEADEIAGSINLQHVPKLEFGRVKYKKGVHSADNPLYVNVHWEPLYGQVKTVGGAATTQASGFNDTGAGTDSIPPAVNVNKASTYEVVGNPVAYTPPFVQVARSLPSKYDVGFKLSVQMDDSGFYEVDNNFNKIIDGETLANANIFIRNPKSLKALSQIAGDNGNVFGWAPGNMTTYINEMFIPGNVIMGDGSPMEDLVIPSTSESPLVLINNMGNNGHSVAVIDQEAYQYSIPFGGYPEAAQVGAGYHVGANQKEYVASYVKRSDLPQSGDSTTDALARTYDSVSGRTDGTWFDTVIDSGTHTMPDLNRKVSNVKLVSEANFKVPTTDGVYLRIPSPKPGRFRADLLWTFTVGI